MAKIGLHDELSLRPAAYNLESPLIELPLYLGLGIVAGLVAVMFKYFSRKVRGRDEVNPAPLCISWVPRLRGTPRQVKTSTLKYRLVLFRLESALVLLRDKDRTAP